MRKRKFAKLKLALYEAEMTQAELARACGRSQAYITRRLNGITPFDAEDMKLIGQALGLPRGKWLDYFLGDTD